MGKKLVKRLLFLGSLAGSITPMSSKAQDSLTVDVSIGLVSNYIAMGYVLGEFGHKQDYIGINKKGFTTFFWNDYDFTRKKTLEIDVGLMYNKQFSEKVSGNVGYVHMHYPEGNDDHVLYLGIQHNGKLNKEFQVANFFPDKEISNGTVLMANISKDFDLGRNNALSFGLSGDYAINFYKDNGLTNITPEIFFSRSGRKVDFSLYFRQQFGFIKKPKMLPAARDQSQMGFQISKTF